MVDHRQPDLPHFDLLAEVFRSAADHQAGDEDGDDGKGEHGVEAGADPAEDHFAGQDQAERHHAAQRRQGVVHGIDRPAGGGGGGHGKETAAGQAETHLFALHVAARYAHGRHLRIAACLRPLQGGKGDDEEKEHRREESPALPGVARHFTEGVGEGGRDEQDQEDLQEIGERRGVLEGVGGVGVEKAAAVGAQFLDGLLGGDRPHRDLHAHGCASTRVALW